jgi:hypothetical protein
MMAPHIIFNIIVIIIAAGFSVKLGEQFVFFYRITLKPHRKVSDVIELAAERGKINEPHNVAVYLGRMLRQDSYFVGGGTCGVCQGRVGWVSFLNPTYDLINQEKI